MPSFQIPVLGSTVGFLSPFLDSLPQLFLKCFPFALAFGLFPFNLLPFVHISSGSGYLASVSSFPLSSCLRLTVASSVHPSTLASLVFPVLPDLVSRVFFPGSSYSAFCSFPFVPPGFAPTAVPPVLPFCFRFRAIPFQSASFRPLLFRFLLLSLCFFLSSFFSVPPHSCFPDACLRSRFLSFLFLSSLISHAFSPDSCTRLSVRFISSLLASLPQPFHQCFPLALAFGLSPSDPFPFVRFSSGSYYSAFCSSFPSLPSSASQLLPRCPSPLSLPRSPLSLKPDLSCLPSRFLYSAFCLFPFALP